METVSNEKIRVQMEYYLSDENLKGDEFFNNLIKTSADGFVDISHFLNCNKIKRLGIKTEEIVNAVKASSLLELSADDSKIRRKGNKPVPELSLLKKKITRETDGKSAEKKSKENDKTAEPVIYEIQAEKEVEFGWKTIQTELKAKNPSLEIVYIRFSKDSGHIAVLKYLNKDITITDQVSVEGVNFKVKKCEGDDLVNFYKHHGSHLEMCLGKNKKFDRTKRESRRDENILKNPVTLGDETYSDLTKIKSRARRVISTTQDNEKVPSPDHDFVLDMLKYHQNFDAKTKDLSHFTVGPSTDYGYSKCLFAVKNDGSKEDFSVYKCIEKLVNQNRKKKN